LKAKITKHGKQKNDNGEIGNIWLKPRDWKKEELGESSNYYIISKTVAHRIVFSFLGP
jgi:hypothetical protein